MKDEGLPKRGRIRKGREIRSILREGRVLTGGIFKVFWSPGPRNFAVLLKGKYPSCVMRSKIKRWVREIYRRGKRPDCRILVLVNVRKIKGKQFRECQEELSTLLGRIADEVGCACPD